MPYSIAWIEQVLPLNHTSFLQTPGWQATLATRVVLIGLALVMLFVAIRVLLTMGSVGKPSGDPVAVLKTAKAT